jgi:hypothetical protein
MEMARSWSYQSHPQGSCVHPNVTMNIVLIWEVTGKTHKIFCANYFAVC